MKARLKLTNISGAAALIPKSSAGTISWLANGELVVAARPGRLPSETLLGPGERLDYAALVACLREGADGRTGRIGTYLWKTVVQQPAKYSK